MTTPRLIRRKLLIRPQFHQVDMMGIIHNAQYFLWFEEGRFQMTAEILPMADAVQRGIAMPGRLQRLHLPLPARYGDDLVLWTTHRLQAS